MQKYYGLIAQGEALPKFQGMGLSHNVQQSTIFSQRQKSAAEIGVSIFRQEPTHASRGFVGTRSSFLGRR